MCLVWRFAAIVGCVKLSCIKKTIKYKKCIVDVLERKLTSSVLVCGLSGFCVIELFVATMRMASSLSTGWLVWHRWLQAGIGGHLIEAQLASLLKIHIEINTTSTL